MKTNVNKDEWISSTLGRTYDVDRAYGAQCWDYFAYFNQDMQTGLNCHCSQSGYVKDLWYLKDKNSYSACFEYIKPADVRRGDWLIWDSGSSCSLSHVALLVSNKPDANGYGRVQGQNQGGTGVTVMTAKLDILGGFRYKGWTPTNGWSKSGDKWNYYENGKKKTGWVLSNSKWYYLKANGTMASNEWVFDKCKWYYLKADGDMAKGWLNINKNWYAFDASGKMLSNAWSLYKNAWYYLGPTGAMQTGWINDGDGWYYLSSSGVMQANKIVSGHKLGANGKCVE